jgi:hypothetical protein
VRGGGGRLLVAAIAGLAAAVAGCADRDAGEAARRAEPAVEFLVAAGDSTYWVTSGAAGVRVRSSPLFLARWGGRLAEVYVADDERAFDDGAWFATQRVYRRDLLTGDSALVFAEPTVPRLAARHATRHPGTRLLDDEERANAGEADEAAPGASTSVSLAAAHGPYLSLEQHTVVTADATERGDEPAEAADGEVDVRRRRVVDLRTGREVSIAELFGGAAAAEVEAAGRRALDSAVAALRPAARRALRAAGGAARARDGEGGASADASPVDVTRRALAALRTVELDPRNFGLAAHGTAPGRRLRRARARRRRRDGHASAPGRARARCGARVVAPGRGADAVRRPGRRRARGRAGHAGRRGRVRPVGRPRHRGRGGRALARGRKPVRGARACGGRRRGARARPGGRGAGPRGGRSVRRPGRRPRRAARHAARPRPGAAPPAHPARRPRRARGRPPRAPPRLRRERVLRRRDHERRVGPRPRSRRPPAAPPGRA